MRPISSCARDWKGASNWLTAPARPAPRIVSRKAAILASTNQPPCENRTTPILRNPFSSRCWAEMEPSAASSQRTDGTPGSSSHEEMFTSGKPIRNASFRSSGETMRTMAPSQSSFRKNRKVFTEASAQNTSCQFARSSAYFIRLALKTLCASSMRVPSKAILLFPGGLDSVVIRRGVGCTGKI